MMSVIRSGLDAAIQNLDVTSNNIANARTTGYKKRQNLRRVRNLSKRRVPVREPARGAREFPHALRARVNVRDGRQRHCREKPAPVRRDRARE